jgi:hypothetical protein
MSSTAETGTRALIAPGAFVEVLTSFATWTRGFRIERAGPHGYTVARTSDGTLLPVEFGFEQVRLA